jgi:hypothetical protein
MLEELGVKRLEILDEKKGMVYLPSFLHHHFNGLGSKSLVNSYWIGHDTGDFKVFNRMSSSYIPKKLAEFVETALEVSNKVKPSDPYMSAFDLSR